MSGQKRSPSGLVLDQCSVDDGGLGDLLSVGRRQQVVLDEADVLHVLLPVGKSVADASRDEASLAPLRHLQCGEKTI